MIIVETNKLSKIYTHDFIDIEHGRLKFNFMRNTIALNKLDLQVHEGESFGLLGPNGAGEKHNNQDFDGDSFSYQWQRDVDGKTSWQYTSKE